MQALAALRISSDLGAMGRAWLPVASRLVARKPDILRADHYSAPYITGAHKLKLRTLIEELAFRTVQEICAFREVTNVLLSPFFGPAPCDSA